MSPKRDPSQIQEENNILLRIAQVNNLPIKEINWLEMIDLSEICDAMVKEGFDYIYRIPSRQTYYLLNKYLGVFDYDELSYKERERLARQIQKFMQAVECLLDLEPHFTSYGNFFPAYFRALQHRQSIDIEHRSLLVGAFTPDTVNEYSYLMHSMFPDARPFVIDIYKDTEPVGAVKPVVADGFDTPFSSNTFDSVQTNCLLHMLKTQHNDCIDALYHLLQEFYRILESKGQIVLVERYLDYVFGESNVSYIIDLIKNILEKIGYKNISITPAESFAKSKGTLRYIEGRDPKDLQTITQEYSFTISAEKP